MLWDSMQAFSPEMLSVGPLVECCVLITRQYRTARGEAPYLSYFHRCTLGRWVFFYSL